MITHNRRKKCQAFWDNEALEDFILVRGSENQLPPEPMTDEHVIATGVLDLRTGEFIPDEEGETS